MLCACDIEEKGLLLLFISKWFRRETIKWKCLQFFRRDTKWCEGANLVGVSRTTVYVIKKGVNDGEGVNRRADSDQKTVVDCDSLRDAIWISPRTSTRQHARRLEVEAATLRQAVAKLGAKSRVIAEWPLRSLAIRAKRLERYQMLVNDLKSAPARRVITFSDEKTWKSIMLKTEWTTAACLLGKKTTAPALCQKRNTQNPLCRSISLHPMTQRCLWSGSCLGIDWLQGTTRIS